MLAIPIPSRHEAIQNIDGCLFRANIPSLCNSLSNEPGNALPSLVNVLKTFTMIRALDRNTEKKENIPFDWERKSPRRDE